MSSKGCLVLTNKEDEQNGHVPFVAKHMRSDKLIVIDPVVAILDEKSLTFEAAGKSSRLLYEGRPIENIGAVWDRRPTPAGQADLRRIHPDCRTYARKALNELANQLLTWFPNALYLPDYYASMRAEKKSWQLKVAAEVGFDIPKTIFTSDTHAAKAFIQSQKLAVIKGFMPHGPSLDGNPMLFFCRKVSSKTKIDFSQLCLGPAIFQQALDVDYELRITVVGNKVFPAKIKANIEADLEINVRDWRIGNYEGGLSIEAWELPPQITKRCFQLVKAMGLSFGAIDVIVDKRGTHWFLEINPNGQWAFVEIKTGQPIGKAIADLLLSACKS